MYYDIYTCTTVLKQYIFRIVNRFYKVGKNLNKSKERKSVHAKHSRKCHCPSKAVLNKWFHVERKSTGIKQC